MKIGDVDFSDVIERAVRSFASSSDTDVRAALYDYVRLWMMQNRPTLDAWLTPPAVYDVKGLVFRRLVEFIGGEIPHEAADNRQLGYVIAAGNTWEEIPTHEIYYDDDHWELSGLFAFDERGNGYDWASTFALVSRWVAMAKIRRNQPHASGCVYLAYSPAFSGLYKIGKAKDPVHRLDMMRSACPDITLVCSVPFGGLILESFLHKRFADRRWVGSEWFDLGSEAKLVFLQGVKDWTALNGTAYGFTQKEHN